MWHAQLQGQGVCVLFFLKLVWTFITSDWVFLVVGVLFLRCERVVPIYYCCFGLFIWLLISGVKKYSQNK